MCYLRVFLFLLGASLAHSYNFTAVVTTTSGPIIGEIVSLSTGHTVRKYLGVPFAKAERFENPQPPTPWKEVKQAILPGKICPQVEIPIAGQTTAIMSEDCLILDVYAPNITNSSLPVMVFIHGGGFFAGGARSFDGSFQATIGNVIVVVIQYRLGVFGYLYNGKKGNFGMLDQIMALKWVQKNIKSFGGNPQQVTIYGESAGGASVALLMLSPLTVGLFKNVIIQSGSAVANYATAYKDEGVKVSRLVGESLKCSSEEDVFVCLKTKPVNELVDEGVRSVSYGLRTGKPGLVPVVDGYFLTDTPLSLLQRGDFRNINVMIGVTNFECLLTNVLPLPPRLSFGINVTFGVQRDIFLTEARSLSLIRGLTTTLRESVVYRYTDWLNVNSPISNRGMFIDMIGDSMFTAPAVHSADAFIKHGLKTYFYCWEHRLPNYPGTNVIMPAWVKAYHSADLHFLIDIGIRKGIQGPEAGFILNTLKIWANFATHGKPDAGLAEVTWPEYTAATRQYLSIKPNFTVESKLRAEHVAFWNDYLPAAINATPVTAPPSTCGQESVKQTGSFVLGLPLLLLWICFIKMAE
ncbi:cholinesterase 1 [Nematostella vectensis]|uniref:cholinesterase 1 n=1 Tax=Nematostella vectensis TaxID=45351 RepID=UPI002076E5C0|nr:cholinesterase 1 [Nematostella vectensis]